METFLEQMGYVENYPRHLKPTIGASGPHLLMPSRLCHTAHRSDRERSAKSVLHLLAWVMTMIRLRKEMHRN
jgi:hypothetical protein